MVPSSFSQNVNIVFVGSTGVLVSRPYIMVAKQRVNSDIGKFHGQIAGNVAYQLKNFRLIVAGDGHMWNAVTAKRRKDKTLR